MQVKKGRTPRTTRLGRNASPELASSVLQVRKAYGETQQQFSDRLSTTVTTVGRYEAGMRSPSDVRLLLRLRDLAKDKGLAVPQAEFQRALDLLMGTRVSVSQSASSRAALGTINYHSIGALRLMLIARLAIAVFPENAEAMIEAAGPAREQVDAILRDVGQKALEGEVSLPEYLEEQLQEFVMTRQGRGLQQ